ncbi:M16 family metallopeptidase [Terriglobus aquaticus]|uniref:M16 family metallopeptidase n=1 Tax=Terriglobus aquaticus TaxID=940139 RepID=A0ABW9KJC4_9BACT|nr:pitrilysin family protein [Terriglobus aquaticus]
MQSLFPRTAPRLLLALSAVLAAFGAHSAQAQIHVESKTLSNGMKILVQEDNSIPNIACYTFYRVGSRNEHEGITGLSHFFEHMMFNGAKRYGKGEFDAALDNAGGTNNAYTNTDTTVYQDWTPSGALPLVLDAESDRMENLAFIPSVVESERQVVYSERRLRTDNSNPGTLEESLRAAAYMSAPYHWPVVGWPSDIEGWTIDDLKSYHAMGYAPGNATMVIVGNVKAADVFAIAEKDFGTIPAHATPPPVRTKEMPQHGERRVEVHKPAELPLQFIAWHTVDVKSPDYYPLTVLDSILTTGQSSRLYRALVDGQQLALSIGSGQDDTMDPGLFTIQQQPRAGVAPQKVEAAIYAELDKLRTAPVDAAELSKAKNQIIAQLYREQQTIAGRAQAIGVAEVFFGSWTHVNDQEKLINAVTAADVQRVLNKYLIPSNRTVATLVPDATAVDPSAPAQGTPEGGAQ